MFSSLRIMIASVKNWHLSKRGKKVLYLSLEIGDVVEVELKPKWPTRTEFNSASVVIKQLRVSLLPPG